MQLEIREHHVRAGQLHQALEREVGQTLDPAELVLAGQLLVERLNVDLEADVFPKPLCPGCGDEGGLLQVGVELAVALALGPQLHAELDGQTPGQKPRRLLLAPGQVQDDPGVVAALEHPRQGDAQHLRQGLELGDSELRVLISTPEQVMHPVTSLKTGITIYTRPCPDCQNIKHLSATSKNLESASASCSPWFPHCCVVSGAVCRRCELLGTFAPMPRTEQQELGDSFQHWQ